MHDTGIESMENCIYKSAALAEQCALEIKVEWSRVLESAIRLMYRITD